jgi:hypothetical protein
MLFRITSKKATAATTFKPGQRECIRRELDTFFSTYPTVAEGFQLKTWRSGPQAGQPKRPPSARSLLDRGLMRLDAGSRPPQLLFTDAGLIELRAMMADRRLADPVKPSGAGQNLPISIAIVSAAGFWLRSSGGQTFIGFAQTAQVS